MTTEIAGTESAAVQEAAAQLSEAAAAKKCWACGCLHGGLASIERAFPEGKRPAALDAAIQAAGSRLVQVQYDCLGCEICYPAVAINALGQLGGENQIAEQRVRAGCPCRSPICTGKIRKKVVKRMVLLDEEDDIFNEICMWGWGRAYMSESSCRFKNVYQFRGEQTRASGEHEFYEIPAAEFWRRLLGHNSLRIGGLTTGLY